MSRRLERKVDYFTKELEKVPLSFTSLTLQRQLKGTAVDFLEATMRKPRNPETMVMSAFKHMLAAKGQEQLEIHQGKREKAASSLGWLSISQQTITSVGSEVGLPSAWFKRNVFFDDSKRVYLNRLSKDLDIHTYPHLPNSPYAYAAGIAIGAIEVHFADNSVVKLAESAS